MPKAQFTINATDKTKAAFKSVRGGLDGVAKRVLSVNTAVLGLVGAGGFGALIKMSADTVDASVKLADKLGIVPEKLTGMQYGIEQIVGSSQGFDEALTKAAKRVGEFNATGGGAAAKWLEKLNFDTQELARLSPDQLFESYSAAIGGLTDRGEKFAAMSALMGDESRKFIAVIDEGPDALASYVTEAQALGFAVNRIDAAKIEAANDAMGRSAKVVEGIGTQMAVQLAPYIEGLANSFGDLAVEHNGFKDEIINGAEAIVSGVAFIADTYRGLEVVWSGLKTVFWGFVDSQLVGMVALDRGLSRIIDMMPGLSASPSADLQLWADSAAASFVAAETELHDLVMTPMPSAGVEAFFAKVRQESQKAAEQVAKDKEVIAAPVVAGDGDDTDNAKLVEKLARDRETILQSLYTEEQSLADSYSRKAEMAAVAFQDEVLRRDVLIELESEYQAKLTGIHQKGFTERQKFAAMSMGEQASTIFGKLEGITAGVAQHNKAMFKINKVAGIANAIISTHQGIAEAWKLGPIIGPPLAAVVAAAGFAQVNAIKSASFNGGGGAAPSVSGTTGATDVVATVPADGARAVDAKPAQQINITVNGNIVDHAAFMRELRSYDIELTADTI